MLPWPRSLAYAFCLSIVFPLIPPLHSSPPPSWSGVLRDSGGHPVAGATIKLFPAAANRGYSATTSTEGQFAFNAVAGGNYTLTVSVAGKIWTASDPVVIKDGATLTSGIQLSPHGQELRVVAATEMASPQASGGERLSTGEVSSLPLNERDFSRLLLLAAGTMTDTNGAANFTQQFAVNGQRGSAAVFAIDGSDTTHPQHGGGTLFHFHVDAIH